LLSACVIGCEERGEKSANGKIQKHENKAKLNLTLREQQRNKLEEMGLFREPIRLQSYRGYSR
jgi:hypothetical protein